jgi:hypothetical protein
MIAYVRIRETTDAWYQIDVPDEDVNDLGLKEAAELEASELTPKQLKEKQVGQPSVYWGVEEVGEECPG